MRRAVLLMVLLLGCQFGINGPTIDELRVQANFAQWQGKDAPMRVAAELDKQMFPALHNSKTIWATKHYRRVFEPTSRGADRPIVVVYHSYRWRVSPEDDLYIRIAIAASSREAHEYLLRRFFSSSAPLALRVAHATRTDILKLGNVCFANSRDGNIFRSIEFIRNNVVVEVKAVGDELLKDVRSIAETIDKLLLGLPVGTAGTVYYNREISERQKSGVPKQIGHSEKG